MFKLSFGLITVLLCFVYSTAQVVPNAEIGKITVQVPLLSNGKPVMTKDTDQVEVARVVELKPTKVMNDEVLAPPTVPMSLVKVRHVRAIVETVNSGVSKTGWPNQRIPNSGIPNPGIPNSGLPNPGTPTRGMPNPGVPNPGMPNPGIPNPGLPNPGIPTRGVPNPGMPNPGMPNPGVPNPGLPNSGIPTRGMPNPGMPNPGLPNPGIPNPGLPNPGIPTRGMPNPGVPNPGMPNRGIPNHGLPNPGIPTRGMPNPGLHNPGIPNPGIPNPGLPNPGIPNSAASELQPVAVLPPITTNSPVSALPKRTASKNCQQLLLAGLNPVTPMPMTPLPSENCDQLCTKFELQPICAHNGICVHEFPNQCVMDTFNCKHRDLAFRSIDEDVCGMGLCARRCREEDLQM